MSWVQRIDSQACSSYGWQARAAISGTRYCSAFFADAKHGGKRKAKAAAEAALPRLRRRAGQIRRHEGEVQR